jgi:phosphoribosylanthranilate isomerase
MLIKASEVSNLTDARYFSAWRVEWIGFCLIPGHTAEVSPSELLAIKEWIAGPKIVGEFPALVDADTLDQYIEKVELDAVQIGQFTPFEEVSHLDGRIGIIREQVIEQLDELAVLEDQWRQWASLVDCFLLDLEKNNISWDMIKGDAQALAYLKSLCHVFPVMLSLRFQPEDLNEIEKVLKPYGISLKGGEEEAVGLKSFDDLDEIFEILNP